MEVPKPRVSATLFWLLFLSPILHDESEGGGGVEELGQRHSSWSFPSNVSLHDFNLRVPCMVVATQPTELVRRGGNSMSRLTHGESYTIESIPKEVSNRMHLISSPLHLDR